MFERFTEGGRQAVVLAQEEARRLHHAYLGTEHLLLGIAGAGGTGTRALSSLGFDLESARAELVRLVGAGPVSMSDREALLAIGIDLDEVRRRIDEVFGPDALDQASRQTRAGRHRHRHRRRCDPVPGAHVPFTPRAKRSLELALRQAVRLGHNHLGTEHLLLGLVRREDVVAVELLRAQGLEPPRVRAAVFEVIDRGDDGGFSLVGT